MSDIGGGCRRVGATLQQHGRIGIENTWSLRRTKCTWNSKLRNTHRPSRKL